MTEKVFGAVDIGGTKTMTGLITEHGGILSTCCFPTIVGNNGAEQSIEMMITNMKSQCVKLGITLECLSGIGVVCAGPVDPVKGTINNPYTLPGWEGYPLTTIMRARTGLTCLLDNDANGMLLGEIEMKKLYNKHVMMITLGTGVGVAIFRENRLFRSNGCYHPEIGHIIVDRDGPACYCHHKGCFESWCSGTSLNRQAQEENYAGFSELYERWKINGDKSADAVISRFKQHLRNGVFSLMAVFKPDDLIFGGGIAQGYFELLRETVVNDLDGLSDFIEPFCVHQAEKNGGSALVGAAQIFKLQ